MVGRKIVDKIMYEEWEFDTEEELMESAKKEAVVCGDRIDKNEDGSIRIFNYHKGSPRWVGKVRS